MEVREMAVECGGGRKWEVGRSKLHTSSPTYVCFTNSFFLSEKSVQLDPSHATWVARFPHSQRLLTYSKPHGTKWFRIRQKSLEHFRRASHPPHGMCGLSVVGAGCCRSCSFLNQKSDMHFYVLIFWKGIFFIIKNVVPQVIANLILATCLHR